MLEKLETWGVVPVSNEYRFVQKDFQHYIEKMELVRSTSDAICKQQDVPGDFQQLDS